MKRTENIRLRPRNAAHRVSACNPVDNRRNISHSLEIHFCIGKRTDVGQSRIRRYLCKSRRDHLERIPPRIHKRNPGLRLNIFPYRKGLLSQSIHRYL